MQPTENLLRSVAMRGLLLKTMRETWLTTLLFGLALMGVMALLTYVIPQFEAGFDDILEHIPLLRPLFTAMLGTEVGEEITARALQSFLWVHPTVLTLLWAHAIVFCTRMPAGEIDRGTIDILLSLPVSRRTIYFTEAGAWLVAGWLLLLMGLMGHRLAAPAMPEEMRVPLAAALRVMANLYCVYVAVGGISFLVSSCSDRRGRAMAAVFTIVLASFLLNFIAQLWEPARQFAFLGLMEYYQPAQILRSERFPTNDIAVLVGIGGVSLLLGGEVMSRRSICTL